ncbi:MAG TPA: DMT family transporter [Ideonella sp.]|jgi:drug/metabolite transporter (DMT)-like permease|nr:DMT family transporter [Ideonella sp.]
MSTTSLYALCVLIWGTTWFAITAQIDAIAPELGVALRFGLAAAALFIFCLWRGITLRFAPRMQALFALQGFAGFSASYVCIYHAERFVVSGVVAVGYAASPLVGLVTARLFLGTPMSRRVAVGGAAGLAGVALIFAQEFGRLGMSSEVILGAVLTAAAVLLSSVSTIAAALYQRAGVSGWAPLAYAMGYGAFGALVAALVAGRPWHIAWSLPFVVSLAYLTLAGSIVAFGAFYGLVHRIGPAKAGYIGVLTPVVALAVSSLLEGFAWTGETVAGVSLAIAGNVIAMWQPRPAAALPQPSESSTTTGA